jgi:dUTP pyrophosphatase
MVTEITMEEMQAGGPSSEVLTHVLMFYGSTCGPCKATMPHYEELSNSYDNIEFYKIDAWNPQEQKDYCKNTWGVEGVPHFKIFHRGQVVNQKVGGGDYNTLKNFVDETLFSTNFSYNEIKVKKIIETALLPEKAHSGDLGYDLFSAEDVSIFPGETKLVTTGVALQFPIGYGGIIKDRSSMATQRKLFTVAGVIDNGYVGELKVALHNSGYNLQKIESGDKIAQLIFIPVSNFQVHEVSEVYSSDARGEGGFGSTGS